MTVGVANLQRAIGEMNLHKDKDLDFASVVEIGSTMYHFLAVDDVRLPL